MPSSFFGIYTAQRSLLLNQAAINVVNSNIANLNTEGYSKQRVEFSQKVSMNSDSYLLEIASQNGIGVTIDDITRNRNFYLDNYYREENAELCYYEELNSNTILIEDIANELSDTGIGNSLGEFYEAAHELSINPTNMVTRTNFLQRAVDVCTVFNNTNEQLSNLRESIVGDGVNTETLEVSKLNLTVEDLNVLLEDIASISNTIALTTAKGVTPNNLLDERDNMLDELSSFIPITVAQENNNLVSVSMNGIDILQGDKQLVTFNTIIGDADNPAVVTIEDMSSGIVLNDASSVIDMGKIGALLDIGGSSPENVTIKGMMDDLDLLAREFARELNNIQETGQYIDNSVDPAVLVAQDPANPFHIFLEQTGGNSVVDYNNLTAETIQVNTNMINNPYLVAAANVPITGMVVDNPEYTGDGSNAVLMGQLRDSKIALLNNATTENFLNAVNGSFGVQASSIYDNYNAQDKVIEQVEIRRNAETGVNLDEEYLDLVRYQKAYEASAKVFQTVDEMLQVVMSLV